MMTALARQELSLTEQAGLLARAALTVAAGRMGGRPPQPSIAGEEAIQAEIIEEVRRRLEITPDDGSDQALRAIEHALDAEMEAVAEPVDMDATLARAVALVMGTDQTSNVRAEGDETRLRAQMPKLPSEALFPLKATTPSRTKAPVAGATAPDKSGDAEHSASPQERFQEWGRLRAPVRDLERLPSLFERVTASFGRQRSERARERDPAVAEEDPGGATRNAKNASKKD
jgi:hypothetical protein